MSYSILAISPPTAIIGIDNTRATFDVNLTQPLIPQEILKGLSNDAATILGLYCGALHDLDKSRPVQNIDSIFNDVSNISLESIGMGVVSFEKSSGEIIKLNAKNCLNNLDIINALTSIQAHYLGFLVGIGLDVNRIKYSKTKKPYLIIE